MEVWSLFAGAYGLDLGLEQAGIQTTMAVELDPWCCRTIRQNRPEVAVLEADVQTLDAESMFRYRGICREVDIMVGGPPCQSFSTGGKRAALTDPRGNLVFEYLRLIHQIRPKIFVLENVASIVTAALRHRPIKDRPGKHWSLKKYSGEQLALGLDGDSPQLEWDEQAGSAIKEVLRAEQTLGYNLTFSIVNSADYGSPQHRLRFVLFGSRDSLAPRITAPTHGPHGKPYVTVRDAIGDLDDPGAGSQYTTDVKGLFELVGSGKNWRSLPPELQKIALGGAYSSGGGKTGFYRRLAWDRPSPTITGRANRKGSALCHPEAARPLSVRECARIQGFPDSWQFSGSMNQKYQQIGNAVPVALGHAIGISVNEYLSGNVTPLPLNEQDLTGEIIAAQKKLRSYASNQIHVAKPVPTIGESIFAG